MVFKVKDLPKRRGREKKTRSFFFDEIIDILSLIYIDITIAAEVFYVF